MDTLDQITPIKVHCITFRSYTF